MSLWQNRLLPHGPWQKISERIWTISGSLPRGKMPRTMVVYRKANGGLVIHSAVVVDETALNSLLSWGKPEILVVPNPWHRLDAAAYKEKFPNVKVVTPRAAIPKVSEKVAVDGAAEELLRGSGFEPRAMDGIKEIELCYEADLGEGKGLIFTDALMNLPHLAGFEGWVLRVIGSTGFFGLTRIGRMILLSNRERFCNWLRLQSENPKIQFVSVAHGEAIRGSACGQALRSAAERLGK